MWDVPDYIDFGSCAFTISLVKILLLLQTEQVYFWL